MLAGNKVSQGDQEDIAVLVHMFSKGIPFKVERYFLL